MASDKSIIYLEETKIIRKYLKTQDEMRKKSNN